MDLDNESSGVSSLEDDEFDDDIYYVQMKPILQILWHGGISDLPHDKRYSKFLYKLSELFLLQHYWSKSDVLVNLEGEMGGNDVIAQNTIGENILDFYNAAKVELHDYIQKFINDHI